MKYDTSRLHLCAVAAATALFFGTCGVRAQTSGIPLWTNFYQPAETYGLAVDRDGSVVAVGRSEGGFATIKYSGAGVPLWTNRYDTPAEDRALRVAVGNTGNVFVAGVSSGAGWATIIYSATGLPLRTNLLPASEQRDLAVDQGPFGFVVSLSGPDYLTVAYSPVGVPLWTNRYDNTGYWYNDVRDVAVDGSGNVVVTGTSGTIKYSSAGVPLWTNSAAGNDVLVDASGNIALVHGAGITKYSGAGVALWNRDAPLQGGLWVGALDNHGNLYAAGSFINTASGNRDILTVKYSSAGLPLWTNRCNGIDNVEDSAHSIVVDSDGNAFVYANSWWSDGVDAYFGTWTTVGYSSAGVPMWTNYFTSPGGAGWAGGAAVDPNGNVFIVGSSYRGFSVASVTIKYSSAVLSRPDLTISRTSGNTIEVSWPSQSVGFALQENTDFNLPLNWSNVPAAVQDDGLRRRVIVNPVTGNRFFRLSKP